MNELRATPLREFVSKTIVSVDPETPLQTVQSLLVERDISSVPVVSANGNLEGILSTTDLLRDAAARVAHLAEPPRPEARLARDLMRTDVVTVPLDADLFHAAREMIAHHIHRVVVVEQDKPVGILSTRDMMRAVFFHHVMTPLSRVMTTPVESIDHGDSIRAAMARLERANVHGLVVTDGNWPVGVFTHTEALHARALPTEFLDTPVERVMSYESVSLEGDTPLYRVAGTAIQTRVRRILVLKGRELQGIASGFDLVRVIVMDE